MPAKNVMRKFRAGKLRSGSKGGPIVHSREQAVAIMLSEARDETAGRGHRRKPTRTKR